ncbi:L-alanine exporter AlaE [Candidatus Woesearchaeota archaeon]|nr:L-alanine exporter AlaE [Candidatus Woesearchaeota archaeon]
MSLEEITNQGTKKAALVDIGSNITYTTIIGAGIDAWTGLNLTGIVAARTASLGTVSLTSAPYGWWTEKVYQFTRTRENANFFRKRAVDLLSFNTFQIPVYMTVVAVGSFVSEGEINTEKVKNAAENLAILSPFIGPTLGVYMNICRKLFGIKTTAEGAYNKSP